MWEINVLIVLKMRKINFNISFLLLGIILVSINQFLEYTRL